MPHTTVNQITSEIDFTQFIHSNFMNEIVSDNFPESYKRKRLPSEVSKSQETNPEIRNIRDRELIRDNIFLKFNFDIFENPFVVFYEDSHRKKLKPFKKQTDAHNFANSNLNKGIHSILIAIMNRDIECKIYRN